MRAALLRVVLGSLVPLVVVSAVSLWLQWDARRRAGIEMLSERADTLAEAVERDLRANLVILQTLAVLPLIDAHDWEEFHAVASAAIEPHPATWIVLIGLDGKQLVNTALPPGRPLPDMTALLGGGEVDWRGRRLPAGDARVLEPGRTARTVVSNLFYGPVLRRPVLSAGLPVLREGRPIASVHIGFTTDAVQALLGAAVRQDDMYAVVLDGNGRIIARNVDADRFVGRIASPPFDRMAELPAEGVGETETLDGVPVVFAYRRLSLTDWTVTVALTRRAHLAPVVRTLVPWLLVSIVLVGAAVVHALRLWQRLVHPLTALAEAARAGREPAVGATGLREVDALAAALARGTRAEREAREQLEERVRERTAVLEQKSRELEATAAELETINEELEAFSYTVSHDLRAPLRSIQGFAHIVLDEQAARLDEGGRSALRRISAAGDRMSRLIDDILLLSRLTRTPMRRETVDLSALARAVAADLIAADPTRDVAFVAEEGVLADGDPGLLRVVLENLLGNAWKYTSRHARAHVAFGVERDERRRRVYYVRDDGAGFDMARAGKLFGAFERLHPNAEFPGTGVGLYSVRRIVHRHGGEVWAEGAVEGGATIRFTLGEDARTPAPPPGSS